MTRRTLLLVLAAAAAACVDNRVTIEVRGHAFPSAFAPCNFVPGGQFQLGPGVLDVSAGRTYGAVLYVKNNASNTTEASPGTVASSNAWRALAARVRVNPSDYIADFPPSPAMIPVQVSQRLPLDGQTTLPGAESAQFTDIISAEVGLLIANAAIAAGPQPQRIVVGVKLEGETLSGTKVDSGEWFYAIDICQGCLPTLADCIAAGGTKLDSCFGPWQDPIACN